MILVHLASGFEEVEALTVVDILRRVGKETNIVSVTGEKSVKGAHGITVEVDYLFEDADYGRCEMIVLPGGLPGAYGLRDHSGLTEKNPGIFTEGKTSGGYLRSAAGSGKRRSFEGKTRHDLSGNGRTAGGRSSG